MKTRLLLIALLCLIATIPVASQTGKKITGDRLVLIKGASIPGTTANNTVDIGVDNSDVLKMRVFGGTVRTIVHDGNINSYFSNPGPIGDETANSAEFTSISAQSLTLGTSADSLFTPMQINNVATSAAAGARMTIANSISALSIEHWGSGYTGTGGRAANTSVIYGSGGAVNIVAGSVGGTVSIYTNGDGTGNRRFHVTAAGAINDANLDVTASGNTVTTVDEVYYPAAGGTMGGTVFTNWSLPSTGAPTPAHVDAANSKFSVLDFPDGSTTTAYIQHRLPEDFTGTTIDFRMFWYNVSTGATAVVWNYIATCGNTGAGGNVDPALSGLAGGTFTSAGNLIENTVTINGLPAANCSGGEVLFFRMQRIGGDASDTCTENARVRGIAFRYKRAQ